MRPRSAIDVSCAFKSRTNFIANFVRDLTTNIRDFSAMTRQLNADNIENYGRPIRDLKQRDTAF
jgi:hypothetical protein